MKEQGGTIEHPLLGDVWKLGDAEITVIGPTKHDTQNINNNSIVSKTYTSSSNIKNIFVVAMWEKPGKNELTLDEITIAYHNLITKPEMEENPDKKIPIKTKKDIAQKLFMMRQDKKNVKATIELVEGSRGKYRLKQN